MGDYWREHGDDLVPVKLIDLASLIARLRQVDQQGPGGDVVAFTRLFTCDMPRLERYLPLEAAREISADLA